MCIVSQPRISRDGYGTGQGGIADRVAGRRIGFNGVKAMMPESCAITLERPLGNDVKAMLTGQPGSIRGNRAAAGDRVHPALTDSVTR